MPSTSSSSQNHNAAAAAALPPWLRMLQRAIRQNNSIHEYDLATLCTKRTTSSAANVTSLVATHMQLNGFPAARTIWIRAIENEHLLFTCDSRSEKTNEIRACNLCALTWYLPMDKEQFRLQCRARLIGTPSSALTSSPNEQTMVETEDELSWQRTRRRIWQESPDWLKESFNASLAPGTPLNEANTSSMTDQHSSTSEPHAHFVLAALEPYRVDYLRTPLVVHDNTRVQHRESLLKPNRSKVRWLFIKQESAEVQSTDDTHEPSPKASASIKEAPPAWVIHALNP